MAIFTVNVQTTGALKQTLSRAYTNFQREADAAVDAEALSIEKEFKRRIVQQVALSPADIDKGVRTVRAGRFVRIIASAEPVQLSRYPHRKTKDGVAVQINPGQFVNIRHARIRGDSIIFFERGGTARTLFGPSAEQIARTEFPELAKQAEAGLKRRLARR